MTLSLGERADEELATWRSAGADRYLLRFETSDRALFDAIHPGLHGMPADRIAILKKLKGLGYETGSGIMIGLPGQSYESVVRDICLFQKLDLDMIGIGPYIAHPETPLGNARLKLERGRLSTGVLPPDSSWSTRTTIIMSKANCAMEREIVPRNRPRAVAKKR